MQLLRIPQQLRTASAPRAALTILLSALLAALLLQWLVSAVVLITDPTHFAISEDDYRQYLVGWPSGSGIPDALAFIRREAEAQPDRPILLVVGGFGRHGSFAIAPRLADVKNLKHRVTFIDKDSLPSIVAEALQQRVWVLEEPPVYEIPSSLLADVSPAPRQIYRYDRQMPRLGKTDGGFRIWEFSPASRLKHQAPSGPPVGDNSPPTLESLSNPNGLEGTTEKRFLWLGGGITKIVVSTGKQTVLQISADLRIGPSFLGPSVRRLLVRTSADFEEIFSLPPGLQRLQVPLPAGRSIVEIVPLDLPNQPANPNRDPRPLIVGLDNFKVSFNQRLSTAALSPPRPVTCSVTFGSGVHNRENAATGGGWFRWTTGSATVKLFSSRAGSAVITGQYMAMVRPETISILRDGQPLGAIEVPASTETLTAFKPIPLQLPAGETTLIFRANRPPVQPAGDPRLLNFSLANLAMRIEGATGNCEVP